MLRYAFRCKDCLSVVFLDTETAQPLPWKTEEHELGFAFRGEMLCPCDGKFETMGRVQLEQDKDGVVIAEELRAPCDARCTHALGPKCTCRCVGCNHGSGRVVVVDRVTRRVKATDGVITQKAIDAAREFRALVEECRAVAVSQYDSARWHARYVLAKALKKALASRSQRHRVPALTQALDAYRSHVAKITAAQAAAV